MTTMLAAETALIEEVSDRIASLAPDYQSKKPFQRYKKDIDNPDILLSAFVGIRQFTISPGKQVSVSSFGNLTSGEHFPVYEYEITIQYPSGFAWRIAANSDALRICSDLLNNATATSGVQARLPKYDGLSMQAIDNEQDPFFTIIIPLVVRYAVTT